MIHFMICFHLLTRCTSLKNEGPFVGDIFEVYKRLCDFADRNRAFNSGATPTFSLENVYLTADA